MKQTVFRLVPTLALAIVTGTAPVQGQGFFKRLFGDDFERAPSGEQLRSQEQQAAQLMRDAQKAESSGKEGKAESAYKKVVRRYPLTKAAANAQFRIAEILEEEGKISSAFDAYQEFIDGYKQSARFQDALDRQYAIATDAKNGAKVSWLGIKRRLETSRIVEMYQTVIRNAPRGAIAPQAQYAIGEVYEDQKLFTDALLSYQEAVDEYPDNKVASDAQIAIAKIGAREVAEGNQDVGQIRAAQEAAQDVLLIDNEGVNRDEALELTSQLDASLAAKSYEIGRYYEKKGNLKAAAIYYNEVIQVTDNPNYADARERLAEIAATEPSAIQRPTDAGTGREIARNDLIVPAEADVAGRADYLGPPPPITRKLRKPKMRATQEPAPLFPVEEPALPKRESIDLTKPIDGGDLLLPPPPPPRPAAPSTPQVDTPTPPPAPETE